MSVSAVTVADRGPSSSRDISPKKEPRSNEAISLPRFVTFARPSTTTKNSQPGSPSRTSTLPVGISTSSTSEAILPSSPRLQAENRETPLRSRTFVSLFFRANGKSTSEPRGIDGSLAMETRLAKSIQRRGQTEALKSGHESPGIGRLLRPARIDVAVGLPRGTGHESRDVADQCAAKRQHV